MTRAQDWTAPPTSLMIADPGQVWWAPVYRNGHLVGAVWMAEQEMIPRAGIVNVPNPDGAFQDDLGEVTLRMRRATDMDPVDWLAHLAQTRTGQGGKVLVGEPQHAPTLDMVRRTVGLT